jgi:hypothetical protein
VVVFFEDAPRSRRGGVRFLIDFELVFARFVHLAKADPTDSARVLIDYPSFKSRCMTA